jgi:ABC-type multidrug transport system fused ATPase/permease subunit
MVILNAATDLVVLAGIAGLLMWVNPVATMAVAGVAASSLWLLNRLTRQRMTNWSKTQQRYLVLLTKSIHEGFGGVKDAKLLGCEDLFVERFSHNAAMMASMTERQLFMGNVPRLWYELLAVTALCALTTILIWQDTPSDALVPTLGMFAVAAFRLLPSVTRLAMASQAMHTIAPLVDTTVRELALQPPPSASGAATSLRFGDAVELQEVSFAYEKAGKAAIADIDMRIPCGASVGIIGPSGAGKSTLVDILLGLLKPTRGQIRVDGVDIAGNPHSWQTLIGYVPQSIFLCDDTIRANIAFGVPAAQINEAAVIRAVRGAQLEAYVAGLPHGLDTEVGERGVRLSGGQRQRIGIARALYHDPEVLVLDEATSALDTETEKEVMQAVEALHGVKTLVIVAHRLTTVANCDTLYRLESGRVVRVGTYAQVCAATI